MKTEDKTLTIIITVFSLIGATFFGIGLFSFIDTQNFIKTAASTEGVVFELKPVQSRKNRGFTYAPVVKFQTPDGKNIQFQSSTSSNPPGFSVGQTVPVLYNRSNPQEAQVDSFVQLWLLPTVFGGFGIIFMGVGATIFVIPLLSNKKGKWLQENGQKIQTKFSNVEWNTSLTVNGQSPYIIVSQWCDPAAYEVYTFRSQNIWFNPEEFIKSSGTDLIDVYVDSKNRKEYYMDISFLPKLNN
jgi:hypothetical protein